MVRFRRHIISRGDTLQSISQYLLGDYRFWEEIARFNNLKHPYIVETVEEKMRNPEHLVRIGDTILIKTSNEDQSDLMQELRTAPRYNEEEIYSLAEGK